MRLSGIIALLACWLFLFSDILTSKYYLIPKCKYFVRPFFFFFWDNNIFNNSSLTYLSIARENKWLHTFPKGISLKPTQPELDLGSPIKSSEPLSIMPPTHPSCEYLLFPSGHPFRHWPDSTLLNFGERTGSLPWHRRAHTPPPNNPPPTRTNKHVQHITATRVWTWPGDNPMHFLGWND